MLQKATSSAAKGVHTVLRKVLPWGGHGGSPPKETMGPVTFYHRQERTGSRDGCGCSQCAGVGCMSSLGGGEHRQGAKLVGAAQSPGPGNAPLVSKERIGFHHFFKNLAEIPWN